MFLPTRWYLAPSAGYSLALHEVGTIFAGVSHVVHEKLNIDWLDIVRLIK